MEKPVKIRSLWQLLCLSYTVKIAGVDHFRQLPKSCRRRSSYAIFLAALQRKAPLQKMATIPILLPKTNFLSKKQILKTGRKVPFCSKIHLPQMAVPTEHMRKAFTAQSSVLLPFKDFSTCRAFKKLAEKNCEGFSLINFYMQSRSTFNQ